MMTPQQGQRAGRMDRAQATPMIREELLEMGERAR
jgi:hypothetical protein